MPMSIITRRDRIVTGIKPINKFSVDFALRDEIFCRVHSHIKENFGVIRRNISSTSAYSFARHYQGRGHTVLNKSSGGVENFNFASVSHLREGTAESLPAIKFCVIGLKFALSLFLVGIEEK